MKTILTALVALVVFSQTNALAQGCTEYSAQVRVVVTQKKTDSLTYCVAKIAILEFTPHRLCPLVEEDAAVQGWLPFALENGHDCEVNVGQEISGVLISNGQTAYIDQD